MLDWMAWTWPIAATIPNTVVASGVITIVPGALVIWFVQSYIAKGFALGRV